MPVIEFTENHEDLSNDLFLEENQRMSAKAKQGKA